MNTLVLDSSLTQNLGDIAVGDTATLNVELTCTKVSDSGAQFDVTNVTPAGGGEEAPEEAAAAGGAPAPEEAAAMPAGGEAMGGGEEVPEPVAKLLRKKTVVVA